MGICKKSFKTLKKIKERTFNAKHGQNTYSTVGFMNLFGGKDVSSYEAKESMIKINCHKKILSRIIFFFQVENEFSYNPESGSISVIFDRDRSESLNNTTLLLSFCTAPRFRSVFSLAVAATAAIYKKNIQFENFLLACKFRFGFIDFSSYQMKNNFIKNFHSEYE